MKNTNHLPLFIICLFLSVFASCIMEKSEMEVLEEMEEGTETVKNQFIHKEIAYPLEKGYLYYYGNTPTNDFFHGIRLHSASITYNETTQDYEGTGSIVSIEMYSPIEGIGEGTYQYDKNETTFTFPHAAIGIHYNVDEYKGTAYDATNGVIEVKRDGEKTHFIFDFTLEDGTSVTGQFKGELRSL